jgi:hypothetical protein
LPRAVTVECQTVISCAGRATARRSRQEDRIMVRSTVRRAAAFAAIGALAVAAGAGPALAADSPAAPRATAGHARVLGAHATPTAPLWFHHCHHGLLGGLLGGVGHVLGGVL